MSHCAWQSAAAVIPAGVEIGVWAVVAVGAEPQVSRFCGWLLPVLPVLEDPVLDDPVLELPEPDVPVLELDVAAPVGLDVVGTTAGIEEQALS